MKNKIRIVPAILLGFAALISQNGHAGPSCVPEYSTKELCVLPSANMSRIHKSPEVLLAAKVVAKKMKPYFPPNDPRAYVIMGYRSVEEQQRIRRSGVRAGPATGKFQSAHIYGVALDIEIRGNRQLGPQMCAALNQVMPLLKNKGGVIMEGSGGGSSNMHIDDNWGGRFSMEKFGVKKSLNYTGPECPEGYGVTGPSAEKYKEMAKITAADVERDVASSVDDEEDEDNEGEPTTAAVAPTKEKDTRKPSSWKKYH